MEIGIGFACVPRIEVTLKNEKSLKILLRNTQCILYNVVATNSHFKHHFHLIRLYLTYVQS